MAGAPLDLTDLVGLDMEPGAVARQGTETVPPSLSLAEVAAFVLPMAPEHLRRVLRQNPGLPQGRGPQGRGPERGSGSGAGEGTPGEQRRFSPRDMADLRAHFMATGAPARWQPARPPGGRAAVVVMAGPSGGMGKTVALCHLAVAAALSGRRVLVIAGDPWNGLAQALGASPPAIAAPPDGGLFGLLARAEGRRLARLHAADIADILEALPRVGGGTGGGAAAPGADLLAGSRSGTAGWDRRQPGGAGRPGPGAMGGHSARQWRRGWS